MDFLNPRTLKEQAATRLAAATYHPQKLALIHSAVSVGVSIVLILMNFWVGYQMESTVSGLSGMGTRSLLETMQTGLDNIASIGLIFWEIGLVFAALRIFRGEKAEPVHLLEGFRRIGPVLGLHLLQSLIYAGLGFVCLYISAYIAMMLPAAQPAVEMILEAAASGDMAQVQQLVETMPMEILEMLMTPLLIIFGVLFLALGIPLFYRFRMARFVIMDQPRVRGMVALILSSRMTRRCRWKLFRLDLSFWWYYLVAALGALLAYLDLVMNALGIPAPFHAETFSLVVYLLGMLVLLVLYWRSNSYVQTTYAAAYEALRTREPEPPKPAPVPKDVPWDNHYEQQ